MTKRIRNILSTCALLVSISGANVTLAANSASASEEMAFSCGARMEAIAIAKKIRNPAINQPLAEAQDAFAMNCLRLYPELSWQVMNPPKE